MHKHYLHIQRSNWSSQLLRRLFFHVKKKDERNAKLGWQQNIYHDISKSWQAKNNTIVGWRQDVFISVEASEMIATSPLSVMDTYWAGYCSRHYPNMVFSAVVRLSVSTLPTVLVVAGMLSSRRWHPFFLVATSSASKKSPFFLSPSRESRAKHLLGSRDEFANLSDDVDRNNV